VIRIVARSPPCPASFHASLVERSDYATYFAGLGNAFRGASHITTSATSSILRRNQ